MMAMSYLMAWKGPVLEKDDKYGNETYNKNAKVVNDIQDGGDYMMAMSYLMAWKGPVLEKDDKYGNETYNKNAKVVKHVQEAQRPCFRKRRQIWK
ncbi:hypothetical protein DXA21_21115 [Parabacteroides distasonis]|nr:hypothetical protein DXA21_21115 [Parabacteroides distasonis]